MSKIRLTITYVVEYEPEVENYEGATTMEEMLAIDLLNAEDDPGLFQDGAEFSVTGEVIE